MTDAKLRMSWRNEFKKQMVLLFNFTSVEKQKISTRTKLHIFRSNVELVLLYGSEAWKVAKTTT